MKISNKVVVFICLLFLLINTFGCSQSEKNKKPDIPYSLLSVKTTTDNIIDKLEQFYFVTAQANGNSKSKPDNKKQNKDSQAKESKDKNRREEEIRKSKQEKDWKSLTDKLEQVFKNWNRYESENDLIKNQVEVVEKTMNDLTAEIEEKKLLSALFKANQLNLELSKLYKQYYNNNLESLLEQIKVYTRNIIYLSQTDENSTTQQLKNLKSLEKSRKQLKNIRFEQEKQQKIKELDYFIKDLKPLINNKNKSGLKIKGNLILNKIEESK